MSATASAAPSAASTPVPLRRRLFGFGSPFGKTVRDSRRVMLLVGGILAILIIAVSKAIVQEFATPASRQGLADIIAAVPPILAGLAGKPVNVETLGGYLSYKYGTFFPIIASLWSILALSGTLAGEARRGSLDFVAAAPISRRRLALETLFGHLAVLTFAMVLVFFGIVIAGSTANGLPGDEISVTAAAGYTIWLWLLAIVGGALAFAIAPFFGRGAAIGIAGAVMFAGFILNGYASAIPAVAPLSNLTWWGWTTNHLPLAGQFDWLSLVPVAVLAIVLFVIGVEAFVRRDLGATSTLPTPSLPPALLGLRGPAGRAAGEGLPSAIAWGIGIGIFGLMIAGSGSSFIDQLNKSPEFQHLLATAFPNTNIASVGGFLQLLFVEFGLILAGLAAATLVAKWASDETSGRLEFLLASPLARVRWVVAGAVGILIGIVVFVALSEVGIAIGTIVANGELAMPLAGTLILGFYAIGLAGIGIGVGGVFGARFAATVVALVTIITWGLDIIAPPLGLDGVREVALSAHVGQPMLGVWDPVGLIACVALFVGGTAIGAWGFARRDLRG
jgi:ABC-2 type transport system permease protein